MSATTTTAPALPVSVLTKRQRRKFGPKHIKYGGEPAVIVAEVRHDDECGNGHNTFSITGEIRSTDGRRARADSGIITCGCIHEPIAAAFPELAPLIKWHLMGTDQPLHYVANTVYHADEHGPTYAWVYFTGPSDPAGVGDEKERLVGYVKADKAKAAEGQPDYRVVWDEKTAKVRNLDHARSSAVWPDATDDDLLAPGLKGRLLARLPQLMLDFKAAVESLGMTY